jgi:molybdate transport system substrate-binding protein
MIGSVIVAEPLMLFRRVLLATLLLLPLPARAADLTVFAAVSLAETLNRLVADYQRQTGKTIAVSLAASSVLAKQIEASAGADILISADEEWMDYLEGKGLLAAGTRRDLLGNRLVLIGPADGPDLRLAPGFDLKGALKGGRLAIADPATVPAGKYGRQALSALKLWDGTPLAPAENVRVALAYVARGEAPLGIVYETDARAEAKVKVAAIFPENLHTPIRYPAALTRDARPEAQAFLAFLSSPAARSVFSRAGFRVLGR